MIEDLRPDTGLAVGDVQAIKMTLLHIVKEGCQADDVVTTGQALTEAFKALDDEAFTHSELQAKLSKLTPETK